MGASRRRWFEPVHPFQRRILHIIQRFPRPTRPDHFRLVQADDCLRQGIVIGITHTSHRGLDPGRRQPLGIPDREILATAVTVMNQTSGIATVTTKPVPAYPAPSARPVPGLPGDSVCVCSLLHPLKKWSLRNSQGGSHLKEIPKLRVGQYERIRFIK